MSLQNGHQKRMSDFADWLGGLEEKDRVIYKAGGPHGDVAILRVIRSTKTQVIARGGSAVELRFNKTTGYQIGNHIGIGARARIEKPSTDMVDKIELKMARHKVEQYVESNVGKLSQDQLNRIFLIMMENHG